MIIDKIKKVFPSTKSYLVTALLITGGGLLVYALFHGSTKAAMPEWTTVNQPLRAAVESLSSESKASPERDSVVKEEVVKKDAEPVKEAAPSASQPGQELLKPAAEGTTEAEAPAAPISNGQPAAEVSQTSSNLLDINQANQSQLETLPGIGPSKAKAIIAYREKLNGFSRKEQLLEVKGIGPKVFDKMSAFIKIQKSN
ncbi:ComEA family DNA-binding protein [Cohnella abietis]|uniref:Helix-hairpin-helix DNA-binding motif class 1 domain-containing protein n=1 Tax=Cohnella abietis TaxID=2507935 RepID=A0A3T1D9L3_9BACL|nr:helix-hairpin-helix domain-containing protein [Cohnella abietis]BBI34773.1 hypothetical protein KCTCHS21_41720 [Cohnella abietis]